ncbi:MAG: SDR family NAD(P)-dependent oxidoreductase [Paracoccaceae bacterium]
MCVDCNRAAADETVALITNEGNTALTCIADVTKEGDVDRIVTVLQDNWGGIDILHFNVGISAKGGVAEQSLARWNQIFTTNLTAAMLVLRAALPMMKQQQSGALVFISSLAAVMSGLYSYASYEASKAALCRMSASIAKEYAPFGIRSNTIVPGMIDTPHVTKFIAPDVDPDTLAKQRASLVPMGRQGTGWDIANAALFLTSQEAGFITGIDLVVDGGMSL